MTPLVPIMLFGWVPFIILLFFRLPAHRAVLVAVIGGFLLLPVAGYDLPGIPSFDKYTAISIGLILGGRMSGQRSKAGFKWSLYDLPMVLWCLSPIPSSLTNQLGLYNGISGVYEQLMIWGIPYLAGRTYFKDAKTLRELCIGIVIGGMVYSLLCAYEIRMSPRLHIDIYGFFQHDWRQHRRYGGWRPIVFMQHGLMVAVWMAACTTTTFWLWRSGLVKQVRGIPMWMLFSGMAVITLLCKSASGWAAMVIGCGSYLICRSFRSYFPIILLLLFVPIYIGIRATGTIAIGDVENHAARLFDSDRTDSLAVRLSQEDLFTAKAMKRPWFGWARTSLAWPVDPYTGRVLIRMIDASWVLYFSLGGLFGVATWLIGMLMGPWLVLRKIIKSTAHQKEKSYTIMGAMLSLIVIIFMVDSLFNGMVNSIYIMVSGVLVSWHLFYQNMTLSQEVPSTKRLHSQRGVVIKNPGRFFHRNSGRTSPSSKTAQDYSDSDIDKVSEPRNRESMITNLDPKGSIKNKLCKRFGPNLQRLVYVTGAMGFMARLQRINGAIILMYHSVADNRNCRFIDPANHVPADIFEQQMKFLAMHRQVVSINGLIEMLEEDKTPPDGTVAITFDDGYLDNLTVAAPILDHFKFPATLFLPTGYIDRGETQWIDQIYTAFKYRRRAHLAWGTEPRTQFNLNEAGDCWEAYKTVCVELLTADPENRRLRLVELYDRLHPTIRPPRLTMTWDDVRTLSSRYHCFELGGHTLEHTDLTGVTEVQAERELSACIQRIKDETDMQPRYFSFCYGRTSKSLRRITERAGFKAACGGEGLDPVIKGTADPFRLPRVEAPRSMRRLGVLTSSANTGVWRRLGRL